MPKIAYRLCALIAVLTPPSAVSGQIVAPLTPFPQCQANKAASVPCVCGVRPQTICQAGTWCSFTPEGAPQCTRTRPLHR